MTEENSLSSGGLDALRKRFEAHSLKAQAYYTVMHEVKALIGSDDDANAWMSKPLPEFGGKTAGELVGEGRAEEVLAHIGALRSRA